MMASALRHTVHQYAKESVLQRVGVWEVGDAMTASKSKYWVVYIHGGAFRDPRKTYKDFEPTINRILSSPSPFKSSIAAFASIDYRLSPHPEFPQDPTSTPSQEYRTALHPDHIQDVRTALAYLRSHCGMTSKYLLVGHSAGATLAFQLLMAGRPFSGARAQLELPTGVIGFEGIYDFEGIVGRKGPAYDLMFTGAYGEKANWDEASPAKYKEGYKPTWPNGKLAVLGWGPGDKLVDEPEIEVMAEVLERDGVKLLVFKDLEGTHDGMWEDGQPFARVILRAIEELERDI